MIIFLSDLRELDRDARPRDQHRAGRMLNNAPRATRSEHNQLRRHLVCDAQDDLRRGALRNQLTRRDKAARSQNGVRPRKYALALNAAFKSLRFAAISDLGCAPTMRSTSRPALSTSRVGMLRALKRAAVAGFSSTFSFTTRTRPAISAEIKVRNHIDRTCKGPRLPPCLKRFEILSALFIPLFAIGTGLAPAPPFRNPPHRVTR
jgi:hypothetical protein